MKQGHNLRTDTTALAMPNGRRVGQPGHAIAAKYLAGRLSSIGLKPFHGDSFALPYTERDDVGNEIQFTNFAGVVRGTAPAGKKPILVGAHYDSVIDAPCADDNAAAVAVALAVAESAMRRPLERDVIIVLFDAEEPPWFLTSAMGSTRFYEDHCRDLSFEGVVIMDLIAHNVAVEGLILTKLVPRIRNLLFALGAESGPAIAAAVERTAARVPHLSVFPSLNRYVGDMSDHHAFRLGGEPYIFLTCAQGKHYHRPSDDLTWINWRKVRKVFRFVDHLIRELDQLGDVDGAEPETADFEVRLLKRALGWALKPALSYLGLGIPGSRKDLDALASLLVPAFMVGSSISRDEELG